LNRADVDKVNSQSESETAVQTEAKIINSIPVLQKALDVINQNNPHGMTLNLKDLEKRLDIKNIEKTNILQVDYKSKEPKVAANVVNQVMNAYVDNNLWVNRAAAISAGKFITGQLPMVKANVNRADAALTRFKEKYKITDLAQTQASVAANIERTRAQVDTVSAQIADLTSRSTALQNQLGISSQQAIAVSSLSQSPAVQGVLAELQDAQRKLADARARYQESTPVVLNLKAKEESLKTLLQAEVAQVLPGQNPGVDGKLQLGVTKQNLIAELIKSEVNRIGLVTELATLSQQQAFYQQQAAILPSLGQQQRELTQELTAAQSTYETLLKNLQDVQVLENKTVATVRIIEAAQVPTAPIDSNKVSAMAAGSLAGILIAAAVVYVLEVRDQKIKTVKEARELFEYTVLGAIPVFGKTSTAMESVNQAQQQSRWQLPVRDNPRSSISESYRMLQAALKFFKSDQALKVIVVTSSVPKEGKSTTCANLAAVMAKLGYKVLIIDADIRRPSQHQLWQIPNQVGLMNIIAGQVNLSKSVIHTVMQNLDVLTAGVSTSNPHVLLDSRRMAALIGQCPTEYEYVIIDTPPIAIAADATIIGKIADGVLLVTRPGLADAINSKVAKEYIDQSCENILGLVVNGVLPENEPYSYYYHQEGHDGTSGSREHAAHRRRNWLDNLNFFRRKEKIETSLMPAISPKAIYWGKTLSKFVSVQLVIQALGFASGIIVIRTLDKTEYAYYTIANTMQGAMYVLADIGISIGLTAIGGKVWQERYRFGQLINTALQLRIYLAAVALTVVTPILLWMLISNGASIVYAILISAAVLVGINAQLITGVLEVVPRLHSQISRVQNLELIPTGFRLVLLGAAYFTFLNTAVAVFVASISMVLRRFIISRWVTDSVDLKAPINKEDRKQILAIIKNEAPNAVFYCIQGQVTIWLISIFGNTKSIAEVGALGRFAVIFSIINAVMAGIILPSFSRCQSVSLLYRRYWQIIGTFCLIGLFFVGFTALFPSQILWVLGNKYDHLKNEFLLMVISTVFTSIVGNMWWLNASRAWIQYSWFNIPGTIATQIILIILLDVSTVKGVIIFGILSTVPFFLVNIFLTFRGFRGFSLCKLN
jgi:capsular exopolysaccharide synthesis family protein